MGSDSATQNKKRLGRPPGKTNTATSKNKNATQQMKISKRKNINASDTENDENEAEKKIKEINLVIPDDDLSDIEEVHSEKKANLQNVRKEAKKEKLNKARTSNDADNSNKFMEFGNLFKNSFDEDAVLATTGKLKEIDYANKEVMKVILKFYFAVIFNCSFFIN